MSTEARREMQETEQERVEGKRCRVAVCAAAGCLSNGGQAVRQALEKTVKEKGAAGEVEVFGTGCLGLCDAGPLVQVQAEGETRLYEKVDPATAARIAAEDAVARHAREGPPRRAGTTAFFAKQRKIVLENSGRIDPERIESCVAEGAYEALQKAVTEMTPLDVIQQITASGLRGRGGGGYPTGLKWSTVYKAKGTRKFVICNADEGDPGAFMDRSVLEGDPHRVLEGMAIAAYAVGADQGYVYVRGEYPLAIQRLKTAIKQAEKAAVPRRPRPRHRLQLPRRHPHRRRRLRLRRGDGPHRLDRGQPRHAAAPPALPGQSGLWGHPTLINNVETFANVAADRPERRRLVRLDRDREEQGHEGLRPRRQDRAHRPRRGADGHHPARDHLRHRRRHPRRPAVQGRADRRPLRRLHPRPVPRPAGRLRVARRRRLDHGLGRPHRHGRDVLHGRRRQVLHGVLPRRVVRQVHPLPRRHRADVGPPRQDHPRRGDAAATSISSSSSRTCSRARASAASGRRRPTPWSRTLRYFRDEYLAHIDERRCPAGVCTIAPAASAEVHP